MAIERRYSSGRITDVTDGRHVDAGGKPFLLEVTLANNEKAYILDNTEYIEVEKTLRSPFDRGLHELAEVGQKVEVEYVQWQGKNLITQIIVDGTRFPIR